MALMNNSTTEEHKQRRLEAWGVFLFFVFILGGLVSGFLLANKTTAKIKTALQAKALTMTSFINPADILLLAGDESDIGNIKYQELKSRLIEANSYNGEIRSTYILGKSPSGELFYYLDSENSASAMYSEPGTTYAMRSSKELAMFNQGLAYVDGPYTNSFGKWVSAYAPIFNTQTGLAFAKIGIDMPADEYSQTWASVFFATFAVGFFIAFVVLIFALYLKKVIHLLRRGASELSMVKNQKKAIEDSTAKVGIGYFKWNRSTDDLFMSDFLAQSFGLESNTKFANFKIHISDEEVNDFESKIIQACTSGNNTLAYDLNFKLPNSQIKALRINCNFSQIYQNDPKVVEGTIAYI